MKKLLVLILALSMVFVFGCKKAENAQKTTDAQKQVESEAVSDTEKENSSEEKTANETENTEEKAEAPKDVKTEHIKEPEDIQHTNELEVLIDEFNNTTDPKRRAELQELLGDFFNQFEGTTVNAE